MEAMLFSPDHSVASVLAPGDTSSTSSGSTSSDAEQCKSGDEWEQRKDGSSNGARLFETSDITAATKVIANDNGAEKEESNFQGAATSAPATLDQVNHLIWEVGALRRRIEQLENEQKETRILDVLARALQGHILPPSPDDVE